MDQYLIYIIIALVSLAVGAALASTVMRKKLLKKARTILEEAKEKAEVLKKEKILQAKEKFLQLKAEHEKFVNREIIPKVDELNKKVIEVKQQIKNVETLSLEKTYKLVEENKNLLVNKFMKIANIEKEVILKCLNFNDYLEDVKYFTEDQTKKFAILLKSKRVIRNNISNEIRRDMNTLFSSIADSEKLFDDVNMSFIETIGRIENKKLSEKILRIKANTWSSPTESDESIKLLGSSFSSLSEENGGE